MSCCLSAVGSAQGSTSTAGLDTWPNASVSSRPCLMQNVAIICHHIIISNIFDDQRQLRLIFAISWTLDQTLSPYESNIPSLFLVLGVFSFSFLCFPCVGPPRSVPGSVPRSVQVLSRAQERRVPTVPIVYGGDSHNAWAGATLSGDAALRRRDPDGDRPRKPGSNSVSNRMKQDETHGFWARTLTVL